MREAPEKHFTDMEISKIELLQQLLALVCLRLFWDKGGYPEDPCHALALHSFGTEGGYPEAHATTNVNRELCTLISLFTSSAVPTHSFRISCFSRSSNPGSNRAQKLLARAQTKTNVHTHIHGTHTHLHMYTCTHSCTHTHTHTRRHKKKPGPLPRPRLHQLPPALRLHPLPAAAPTHRLRRMPMDPVTIMQFQKPLGKRLNLIPERSWARNPLAAKRIPSPNAVANGWTS